MSNVPVTWKSAYSNTCDSYVYNYVCVLTSPISFSLLFSLLFSFWSALIFNSNTKTITQPARKCNTCILYLLLISSHTLSRRASTTRSRLPLTSSYCLEALKVSPMSETSMCDCREKGFEINFKDSGSVVQLQIPDTYKLLALEHIAVVNVFGWMFGYEAKEFGNGLVYRTERDCVQRTWVYHKLHGR